MTVRNIQNVSATNMRVNLTEVIGDLDNENIVAVTKHKKVIAYVISPEVYNALAGIEPEDVADDSPPEEPTEPQEVSEVVDNDDLDDYLEHDSDEESPEADAEVVNLDEVRNSYSTLEESDEEEDEFESLSDEDFDSYLENLKRQTMGFVSSDNF